MNNLTFIKDYRHNEIYRRGFNDLTRRTYGFDFEDWYRRGYWGGAYIPYSLADGDRIAASISVNIMKLVIGGADINAVQLGTVMTDAAYRGHGLSRELMDIILTEYENTCDFIYLFANRSVLDFYPKFGFERYTEYECRAAGGTPNNMKCRKLNLDDPDDRALFLRLIDNTAPAAQIGCRHDRGLVMFYCTSFYKDCIWYLPALDLAAVAFESDGELNFIEVFSEKDYDLNTVVGALADAGTKIVFGFTPKTIDSRYTLTPKTDPDDTLFIRSKQPQNLPRAMFPLLSKA